KPVASESPEQAVPGATLGCNLVGLQFGLRRISSCSDSVGTIGPSFFTPTRVVALKIESVPDMSCPVFPHAHAHARPTTAIGSAEARAFLFISARYRGVRCRVKGPPVFWWGPSGPPFPACGYRQPTRGTVYRVARPGS